MTSTHGVPTLQDHINVSVKRDIVGMDLNVQRKIKRLELGKFCKFFMASNTVTFSVI